MKLHDRLQRYHDEIHLYEDSGPIEIIGKNHSIPLQYLGMEKEYPVSRYFGGSPVAVVDETVFEKLKKDTDLKYSVALLYISGLIFRMRPIWRERMTCSMKINTMKQI